MESLSSCCAYSYNTFRLKNRFHRKNRVPFDRALFIVSVALLLYLWGHYAYFLYATDQEPPRPRPQFQMISFIRQSFERDSTTNSVLRALKKKLAIVVVTDTHAATENWIQTRLTHFQCYAKTHGYTFIHHVVDERIYQNVSFYTARWHSLFHNYWGEYEWIFAHDTDSMYPDFSVNLDKFLLHENGPHIHLLARGTEIGANAVLFRASNSKFTEAFFRRVIDLGYRKPRPQRNTNYDVRDFMLVVLELLHPELARLCAKIDEFFEFARCFTPAIERLPSLPRNGLPIIVHAPMSGFVQQFESPEAEYGLLFGACWPGHVLISGNGVKGRGPSPRGTGVACARDESMSGECRWLTREEQIDAASKCCLIQASVCASDNNTPCGNLNNRTLARYTPCEFGWPVLWAAGGEVKEPRTPECGAPYIKLRHLGVPWDNEANLKYYSQRLASFQSNDSK